MFEIGSAVIDNRKLPAEIFFTTDVVEGHKINLLEEYTLTSISTGKDSSIQENNITAYHTIHDNSSFESYHYVIDTGKYAFILTFYSTDISRPVFDDIAKNLKPAQENS